MPQANTQQLPRADEISISKKNVKEANSRKRYRAATYAMRVMDATNKVSEKKGSLMTVAKLAALTDPSDIKSAVQMTAMTWIIHPLQNPKWPGHKIPKTAGMTGATFRALSVTFNDGKEAPSYPKMNAERSYDYNGNTYSKEEAKPLFEQTTEQVMNLSLEVWGEPAKLINKVSYVRLSYEEGSDFPRIKFLTELDEDEELTTDPDQMFEDDTSGDEGEPEFVAEDAEKVVVAPKNGKAAKAVAPTKKAPAAKKGKK